MFQYRKELDGLRAFAVISVMIYHANLQIGDFHLFQGGLFGVDVFFVLSGYLITGIIRNQMDKDRFSFLYFYWRRAKRIVPALLTMLLVTSIISYFILLPDDLVTYAKSLQSALYFGSNYYFNGEDSYVSDASIYKPLLHTWSLALEWQFYLIYPIIVWFINKFFKQYMFGLLLVLAFLSLQYANVIVPNYPDEAFYLLQSRAWELILGGLITFYNRDTLLDAKKGSLEEFIYKSLPLLGLFLVAHSMLFIGHGVLHPSFLTLIPVLGTCLFIMFTHKGELTNDLLSIKPIVFIGLISYPLYLWHQPIFVFFRLIKHEHFRYEQFALLALISGILAFITYYFIESNYRKKSISRFHLFLLALTLILVGVSSQLLITNKGFPFRLKGNIAAAYDSYKQPEYRRLKDQQNLGASYFSNDPRSLCDMRTVDTACKFKDESWVILGDSFAGMYEYSLQEKLNPLQRGLISLSYEQCPFVSPDIWFGGVPECGIVNKNRLNKIKQFKDKKKFIIAANYHQFDAPKKRRNDPINDRKKGFNGGNIIKSDIAWKSYADNINSLLDAEHEVFLIYPLPRTTVDVKKMVFSQIKSAKHKFNTQYSQNKTAYDNANKLSVKLDSYLPDRPLLHKIYPKDILCDGTTKKCQIINQSGGLYNGGSHLSYFGAQMILDQIPLD